MQTRRTPLTDAADAVDAADATDAADGDATDGDPTAGARADAVNGVVVRGTDARQNIVVSGFQPGETVFATVFSTPFDLTPVTVDASGMARMSFAVGPDFELGAHRVEIRGSVTGDLPQDRENTAFLVVDPANAGPSGDGGGDGIQGGLPQTGAEVNAPLALGGAALLLLFGAGLWSIRRRENRRTNAGE